MQRARGVDWEKAAAGLAGAPSWRFLLAATDTGHMDIEYPRFMQPCLSVLRVFGALVNRCGRQVRLGAGRRLRAKSGCVTVHDIEKSIRECSPNAESRKAGHIEEYARRAAEKAWSTPEVQQHRLEPLALRRWCVNMRYTHNAPRRFKCISE